jgi:hypothetical protein
MNPYREQEYQPSYNDSFFKGQWFKIKKPEIVCLCGAEKNKHIGPWLLCPLPEKT